MGDIGIAFGTLGFHQSDDQELVFPYSPLRHISHATLRTQVLESHGVLEAHHYEVQPLSVEALAAPVGLTPPGHGIVTVPREGQGHAIGEFFDCNTSPYLVLWDLFSSFLARADHRLQVIFVRYAECHPGKEDALLQALNTFLDEAGGEWGSMTYSNLLQRLCKTSRLTPSDQVSLFISEFFKQAEHEEKGKLEELENSQGSQEYHQAEDEEKFKDSYEELQQLYVAATQVVYNTAPTKVDHLWINSLLLMAEIGILSEGLSSTADLIIGPHVFRDNLSCFLQLHEQRVERNSAAHFYSMLLQRDFAWEFQTKYPHGIEEDTTANLFEENGTRKRPTKGTLLRYEPILQEIKGSFAAQLNHADIFMRMKILDSNLIKNTAMNHFKQMILPLHMVNLATSWWKCVLGGRYEKLLMKLQKVQKQHEQSVGETRQAGKRLLAAARGQGTSKKHRAET